MEKRHLVKPAIIYGVVWFACLALYWGSLATGALGGGGIMGYVILALHIVLPIADIVSAFLIGRVADLGWFTPWRRSASRTPSASPTSHRPTWPSSCTASSPPRLASPSAAPPPNDKRSKGDGLFLSELLGQAWGFTAPGK